MCVDCPELNKTCNGTTNQLWSGCVYKHGKTNPPDLIYCCLGNGVSIADKSRMEHNDYAKIGHIRWNRDVTLYRQVPISTEYEIRKFAGSVEKIDNGELYSTGTTPPPIDPMSVNISYQIMT